MLRNPRTIALKSSSSCHGCSSAAAACSLQPAASGLLNSLLDPFISLNSSLPGVGFRHCPPHMKKELQAPINLQCRLFTSLLRWIYWVNLHSALLLANVTRYQCSRLNNDVFSFIWRWINTYDVLQQWSLQLLVSYWKWYNLILIFAKTPGVVLEVHHMIMLSFYCVCNAVQRKGTKTSDKNQNIDKDMVGHDLIICSRYKSTLLFIALTANGFFLCGERGAFALSLVLHLTIKQNLPFFVQNHAKICTCLWYVHFIKIRCTDKYHRQALIQTQS